MTRNANILSFDEVKAHGASAPRTVSSSRSTRSSRSSRFGRPGSSHAADQSRSALSSAHDARRRGAHAAGRIRSGQDALRFGDSNAAYGEMRHGRSARFGGQRRSDRGSIESRLGAAGSRSGGNARRGYRSARGHGYLSSDAYSLDRTHGNEGHAPRSHARKAAHEGQGFFCQARKRFRSAKADRAFEKTVGSREAKSQTDQGSRAALYEMRMGSTHRKSARMQDEGGKQRFSLPFSVPFGGSLSNAATRSIVVMAVAVFTVFMLYPPFQNYYIETRQLQQLQAEYAALADYNDRMQSQIDYLNTDAGLEDYARSELGWIRENEHVVTVEGVQPSADATSQADARNIGVLSEEVPTPDTWYSGVLDVLFGYGS